MKHSYLLAGIKANRLLTMLMRNKGVSIKYIPRILFLLNAGVWSNIFSWVEKSKFKNKIEECTLTDDPIFIIGNWRTGSTFLHQLLALDQQFTTPTVYQVSNPDHMLVSKKYYKPIMNKALGKKRPMDNVLIGIDEPQEDEYALLKLCKDTPLEKLIFAKGNLMEAIDNYSTKNPEQLKDAIHLFTKKLSLSKQRVLYKNPFHSLRIDLLKELYPNAKFIHIYRHPEKVIPSNWHMWNVVGSQNALNSKWQTPTKDEIAKLYRKIVVEIKEKFKGLAKDQCFEIKFEEFEKAPIEIIKATYKQLNLVFSNEFETKLNAYCNSLKDYKKNSYEGSEDESNKIKSIFKEVLPEYYN